MRSKRKAWIVAANMGYGHQRAAYPLKDIAFDRIINANSDKIVTPREKRQWSKFQRYYEGLSRFTSMPIIGKVIFRIYDRLQQISPYYPFRDLSKPTWGSLYMHRLIKKEFLRSLIEYVKKEDLPFISTFFATAIAAAHAKIKDVYCVVTDTDINRIWVPEDPTKERLVYFTPTERCSKRLLAYGVPGDRIVFTGFPLPKENTGRTGDILLKDLGNRLPNLDPNKRFHSHYKETIKKVLGKHHKHKSSHILTLTFAVGGAGAQKEIGAAMLASLKHKILHHKIRVNLIAGTRLEIQDYFESVVKELGMKKELGKGITILSAIDKKTYFTRFNELLHNTDVLWTKPSELVFYTGLGIPIIIAPPIGAHEVLNAKWLRTLGSGFHQENPKFIDEWLFDWLEKGILAEAAWEGYVKAPSFGTYNIEKVVFSKGKKNFKLRY